MSNSMSNLSEDGGEHGSTDGLVLQHTDLSGLRARRSAKDRQEEVEEKEVKAKEVEAKEVKAKEVEEEKKKKEEKEDSRSSAEALSQEDMRPLAEQLVEWAGKNPIPAAVASLMLVLLFLLTQTF